MSFQPSAYQEAIFAWVREGSGHGLVEAVAGSGKTRTIVEAARLVQGQATLFCAFNREIRRQLAADLGAGVTCRTVHALGYETLKRSRMRSFRFHDGKLETIAQRIAKESLKEQAALEEWYRLVANQFSEAIEPDDAETPAFTREQLPGWVRRTLTNIGQLIQLHLVDSTKRRELWEKSAYHGYEYPRELSRLLYRPLQHLLEESEQQAIHDGRISFDEMVWLPWKWALVPQQFDWVFVDECQDLSAAQLDLVSRAVKPGGRMLLVGDPWQAIYGFAGGDPQSIARIRERLDPRVLPLSVTYRCPQRVVEEARAVCVQAHNAGLATESARIEARPGAAAGLVETIDYATFQEALKPGDAVLARRNAPLAALLLHLRLQEKQVWYRGQENLADLLRTTVDIGRQPGFSWTYFAHFLQLQWLEDCAALPPFATARRQVDDRFHSLMRCHDTLAPRTTCLEEFIDTLDGLLSSDGHETIEISTIHQYKGAEADRVFLLDLGDLPMLKPGVPRWEWLQEYHLLYVATTRARQELYRVTGPEVLEALGGRQERIRAMPGPHPCPDCGGPMLLRTAESGPFWGCANYPRCRGVRDYALDESCPMCGLPLALRRAKEGRGAGRLYAGCGGAPHCTYTRQALTYRRQRGRLIPRSRCEECGNPLMEVRTRTGGLFEACSAWPDCDWRPPKN